LNYPKSQKELNDLKTVLESHKELFSTFAHDIRNFANSLSGFLNLLELNEQDTNKLKYISSAQHSVNMIINLVNDIVELSKIEAGKMKINEYFYLPAEEYENTYKMFHANAIAKNIQMYGYIDPRIPYAIKGDEYRIKQIIGNLLNNSIKFTDENGSIFFKVELNSTSDMIVITVADNGIGMNEEEKQKLFEKFEQASLNTSHLFGGSGLGMSILYNLVQLMDGKISVKSKKNVGTVIKVYLPLKAYDQIPEIVSKNDLENQYLLVQNYNGEINSRITKMILKFFKNMNKNIKIINYSDIKNYEKDHTIIIPDIENEYINEQFTPHFTQNKNNKFIFIKSFHNLKKALAENIEIIPFPFIGGETFIQALLNEKVSTDSIQKEKFKNLSVLVIDDNPINLKIMKELLQTLNMTPYLAENKDEAMEILEKKKIDIIFMDEIMPVINGSDLIKKIKSNHKHKDIKVFGLTGDTKEETIEKLLEAGAVDVLTKPVSIEKLKSAFYSV